MTRVTEHTRGATPARCSVCGGDINPGDRYRRMVAVQEDWAGEPFACALAHLPCTSHGDFWRLTADRKREAKERAEGHARTIADFNARAGVGSVVTVWRGLREGTGIRAETLQPAGMFGGHPAVRVRLPTGGTDYVSLTHVEVSDA